ncbi:MAG TPA: GAF domain-containing SpoIIE family protein phosphatase [Streptosporangiaceae bacterium]|jgi:serine phosphatase RsbU (regulator of sigma subunit)|nr:GAF domain-containing SpoIIE family protein phosphatase [Streptosporangiaceae bacterium]
MHENRADVERSVWRARPASLVGTALGAIGEWLGVEGAEVLLIDYHQSHLVPFGGGAGGTPIPVDSHPAGRAFASGRSVPDQEHLFLPLSVHGERLGVLTVRLPQEPEVSQDDLEGVADTLARALRIADTATDIYREVRRRKRLTVAAEMQWELLPGRTCESAEFRLAGQLEPAYAVSGDNFDWVISPDYLTLSVSNGMGSGLGAALLTQLTVNSLRNARRSGAGPAESAELASGIVYSRHGGEIYSPTLLMRITLSTGEAEVIDAGSPRMLRIRHGEMEPFKFDEQMPIGMFSDTRYRAQRFTLVPGDRFVILSDGVYAARGPSGRVYGQVPLSAALRSARLQSPNETVRFLISDLLVHHEGAELTDDAIAVCLDWSGAADEPGAAGGARLADIPRPGDTSLDVMT